MEVSKSRKEKFNEFLKHPVHILTDVDGNIFGITRVHFKTSLLEKELGFESDLCMNIEDFISILEKQLGFESDLCMNIEDFIIPNRKD